MGRRTFPGHSGLSTPNDGRVRPEREVISGITYDTFFELVALSNRVPLKFAIRAINSAGEVSEEVISDSI